MAGVVAYEFAGFVLDGDMGSFLYFGMLVASAIGLVTVLNDWRKGVYLFIAWILFEDFFRKYLGNNMAVYFAKDALALLLYLSFLRDWRRNAVARFRPLFLVSLLCFFFLGLIQVFNPNSTSFFFGLMGIKLYFFYIPLLYVGYYFIDSEKRLQDFLLFNSILILIIVCLGVAQSILGHTFLNPVVIQEDIRDLSTIYRASPISGSGCISPYFSICQSGPLSKL